MEKILLVAIFIFVCHSCIVGFVNISHKDQILAVKTAFFEVWLVWISRTMNPKLGTLTFSHGITFSQEQLSTVYGLVLVKQMFEFGDRFRTYKLSECLLGLYCAVLLLTQGLFSTFHLRYVWNLNFYPYELFFVNFFKVRIKGNKSHKSMHTNFSLTLAVLILIKL